MTTDPNRIRCAARANPAAARQAAVGVRLAEAEAPQLADGPLLAALATRHLARVLRTASSQQALDAATFAIQARAPACAARPARSTILQVVPGMRHPLACARPPPACPSATGRGPPAGKPQPGRAPLCGVRRAGWPVCWSAHERRRAAPPGAPAALRGRLGHVCGRLPRGCRRVRGAVRRGQRALCRLA